jgi:hypothetical protein
MLKGSFARAILQRNLFTRIQNQIGVKKRTDKTHGEIGLWNKKMQRENGRVNES